MVSWYGAGMVDAGVLALEGVEMLLGRGAATLAVDGCCLHHRSGGGFGETDAGSGGAGSLMGLSVLAWDGPPGLACGSNLWSFPHSTGAKAGSLGCTGCFCFLTIGGGDGGSVGDDGSVGLLSWGTMHWLG